MLLYELLEGGVHAAAELLLPEGVEEEEEEEEVVMLENIWRREVSCRASLKFGLPIPAIPLLLVLMEALRVAGEDEGEGAPYDPDPTPLPVRTLISSPPAPW